MQSGMTQTAKDEADQFRLLVDMLPQLVWIGQPDGTIEYRNQRWYEYTQATPEQSHGRGWISFFHPDDRQKILELRHTSLLTSQPFEVEARIREGKTGVYRWFLIRSMPVMNTYGQVLRWFGTCTDIHEKKCTEEMRRRNELYFRKLFASTFIGMVSRDLEGRVLDANDTFLQFIGYTRQDLQSGNLHWSQIVSPHLFENDHAVVQQLRATGYAPDIERELRRKDGGSIWVLLGTTMLDSFTNTILAFAVDINERKLLEKRKDEFISLASHELKSPLASLKLIAQYLGRKLKKGQIQEAEKYLMQITTQIDNSTRLVNDLLDLSKIRSGNLTYTEQAFDFDSVIQEIVTNEQKKAPQHQLLLQGVARTSFVGDRLRISQVLINLIDNAVKYSPLSGKIEITVAASQDTITISVRDYGPGIAREHLDKIFECFYRVSSKKESGIAGLGMGLYLSSSIVKHYGGEITVESTVGKGSTFTISLPVKGPGSLLPDPE